MKSGGGGGWWIEPASTRAGAAVQRHSGGSVLGERELRGARRGRTGLVAGVGARRSPNPATVFSICSSPVRIVLTCARMDARASFRSANIPCCTTHAHVSAGVHTLLRQRPRTASAALARSLRGASHGSPDPKSGGHGFAGCSLRQEMYRS